MDFRIGETPGAPEPALSQATPRGRHLEEIVFTMYAFIAMFALVLLVFMGIVVGLATGKLKPSHPGGSDHDFGGSSGPDF